MRRFSKARTVCLATLFLCATILGITAGGVQDAHAATYPVCKSWARYTSGSTYYKIPSQLSLQYSTVNCVIGKPQTSEAVTVLQNQMKYAYKKSITVDGVYGSDSEKKMKEIQGTIGVTADGVYGPNTKNKMCFMDFQWKIKLCSL